MKKIFKKEVSISTEEIKVALVDYLNKYCYNENEKISEKDIQSIILKSALNNQVDLSYIQDCSIYFVPKEEECNKITKKRKNS